MFSSKSDQESFGIYIHIPFCKQACHYCDFHFSTSFAKKGDLVNALCEELNLRKNELSGRVATIYFGGGTPSLLTADELKQIFKTIYSNYEISENPEITLEANPDDLINVGQSVVEDFVDRDLEKSPNVSLSAVEDLVNLGTKLETLKKVGINRLSIGVQSFFEEDLKLMNRAHNAIEAVDCIKEAKRYFNNISIDLIYGIPGMSNRRWLENLNIAFDLDVPHLSCYALTVEPKTALKSFIDRGMIPPVDEQVAKEHYEILVQETEKRGFDNYEFSNFGKTGFESRNNTAYWEGKSYLGIGPSAHSYNGNIRSWNVANNTKYIKSIAQGGLPSESEVLSMQDKFNEYVMTSLRTQKGISLELVREKYGEDYVDYLKAQSQKYLDKKLLAAAGDSLKITFEGKFLGDGIASDLFWI